MPSDPSGIESIPSGSLTLEFDDDLTGHAWFDSIDEDFDSDDYPIERLTRPMLADCSEG